MRRSCKFWCPNATLHLRFERLPISTPEFFTVQDEEYQSVVGLDTSPEMRPTFRFIAHEIVTEFRHAPPGNKVTVCVFKPESPTLL